MENEFDSKVYIINLYFKTDNKVPQGKKDAPVLLRAIPGFFINHKSFVKKEYFRFFLSLLPP